MATWTGASAAQLRQFLPHRGDGHLQVVAAFDDRLFPDAVVELFVGKHLAGICGQKGDDVELQRGEITRRSVVGDHPAVFVDAKAAELHRLRIKHLFGFPDSGLDAQFQLENIVRLCEEIVSARPKAGDAVFHIGKTGEENDRRGADFPDLPAELKPVDPRHADIQNDAVDREVGQHPQCLLRPVRTEDLILFFLKIKAVALQKIVVVVNKQQFFHPVPFHFSQWPYCHYIIP